jgi:hypothetical protein
MINLLELGVEDAADNVRAITGLLTRQEILLNLGPIWVAGDGDEKTRLPKDLHDAHSVLV